MTNDTKNFDAHLAAFVIGCNLIREKHYAGHPDVNPRLGVEMGRRYVKLIDQTYSRSVYCFVDRETGNVLKAASWKAPAKGTRGNIYNADNGLTRMTPYGTAYNI